MKQIIFLLTLVFLLAIFPKSISAGELCSSNSACLKSSYIGTDNRVEILRNFFKKYDSPLIPYADEFIAAADYYEIDWKLVPSITGVESTFGKHIPYKSYNAYGWANGVYKFQSWEDSIWHVTKTLKAKYIDRGYKTVPQIARIYAPPSTTWAHNVQFFMGKIEATQALTFDL